MKRTLSILICVTLITCHLSIAFASMKPYASRVFDDALVSIDYADGKVYATAIVSTIGNATKLGFKSITIYVENGDGWSEVKRVTNKYVSNIDSSTYTIYADRTVGKHYKGEAICYGIVNGISDSVTCIDVK